MSVLHSDESMLDEKRPVGNVRQLVSTPLLMSGPTIDISTYYVIDYGSDKRRIALSEDQARIIQILQLYFPNEFTTEELRAKFDEHYGSSINASLFAKNVKLLQHFQLIGDTPFLPELLKQTQLNALAANTHQCQLKKAIRLISWARETIPFYEKHLHSVNEICLDQSAISALPLMSKDHVRRHLPQMVRPSDINTSFMYWATSSGSTGERQQSATSNLYSLNQYSQVFELLPQEVDIFPLVTLNSPICSGTECHRDMELPREKRWDGIRLRLNSVSTPATFSEKKLAAVAAEFQEVRPATFLGNGAYMVALAHYFLKNNISIDYVKTILLGDEVQSRIHKHWLGEAFGCPIYEIYGMSEISPISVECKHGNMHVLANSMYVEVLAQDGQRSKNGELGQITVTTLEKTLMPYLRYQTRDLAKSFDTVCTCGQHYPIHGLVEGRLSDLITTSTGEVVTPRQVDEAIASVTFDIGWYSLVQRPNNKFTFYYTPIEGRSPLNSTLLADKLQQLLGKGAQVSMSVSKSVSPSTSGKFRLCYQETDTTKHFWR